MNIFKCENGQRFKAVRTEMWSEWLAAAYAISVSIKMPGGITNPTTKLTR